MLSEQIKTIIEKHQLWLKGKGGSKANLFWANLSEANLSKANLSWANLSEANLSLANLSCANLSWANLFKADLSWANLSKADLSKANLSGADLYKADLSWANLSEANLSGANLSLANLSWANLSNANLSKAKYSIVAIMECGWGCISDDLTLELMRHDAKICGINAMNRWAKGGECPFQDISRKYYFKESRELWIPGKPTMKIKALFQALAKEKNIKIVNKKNS